MPIKTTNSGHLPNRCLGALVAFLLTTTVTTSATPTPATSTANTLQNQTRQLVSGNRLFIDQATQNTTTANLLQTPSSTSSNGTGRSQQVTRSLIGADLSRRNSSASLSDAQISASLPRIASNSSLPNVRQRWRQMESSMSESLGSLSAQLKQTLDELPAMAQTGAGGSVSPACRRALYELLDGLASAKLWASQMLDASARLPSGLLEGTLTELGNLDECLGVEYQSEPAGDSSGGQYCSLLIKPHLTTRPRLHTVCQHLAPFSSGAISANQTKWSPFRLLSQNSHHFYYAGLRLGVCTPSKCSRSDLQLMLTNYLSKYELLGQVRSCQLADNGGQPRLDLVQQCIVLAFLALLLLCFAGTLADLCTSGGSSRVELSSLSANTTSNCDETMQTIMELGSDSQRQVAESERRRVQGKCWQYQLHRLGSDLIGSDCSHSLATQRNPIAELAGLQYKPVGSDHKGGLPATFVYDSEHPEEEEWIVRLERNQNNLCQREKSPVEPTSERPSTLRALLVCFSIRRSLRIIGKHSTGKQEQQRDIKVIHGIRTITMFWIVFGHTVGLVSPDMMNNLFALAQLSCSSRFLQAILNATLAVNTFFMLSGLVTVLSFARKCKSCQTLITGNKLDKRVVVNSNSNSNKTTSNRDPEITSVDSSSFSSVISSLSSSASSNRCINQQTKSKRTGSKQAQASKSPAGETFLPSDFKPLLWLALRYLRLTPSYAAIIGLAVVLPALGSGPFWQESVNPLGSACRRSWWLNLVYLNNFIDTERLCLIHSWYLSNDWQFFSLTLILLAVFYKSRKLALLLVVCLVAASSAVTFTITVTNDFPPTIVTTSPALAERWLFIHSLYYKPWPHLGSYLVGLLAGYCVIMRARLQMSSGWRAATWFLLTLMALTLLNSIYPWNMGVQVEPLLTGLHSATFRTLWATCCAWLVFALVTRPNNPLARLLSWHGFQVTSRLTYATYLVHPLVIFYHFGTLRERIDSSVYGQVHRFVATLTLSYLAALLLSLLVESPAIQLQHLLISALTSSTNQKNLNSQDQLPPKTARSASESSRMEPNWSASSSFSEQVPVATGQQPALVLSSSFVHLKQLPSHCERLSSRAASQQNVSSHSSDSCSQVDNTNKESSIALDAEFQEKLAQAISRGFRIRSKLANGTMRQANSAPKRTSLLANQALEAGNRSRSSVCEQGRRSELSTFRQQQHKPASGSKRSRRSGPADLGAELSGDGFQQAAQTGPSSPERQERDGRANGGSAQPHLANLKELIMMKQQQQQQQKESGKFKSHVGQEPFR